MKKLKIIAKETVDIKGIGFYSLGSARKNLNDNQKKNIQIYLKIFFKKFFK
jgi:phospholipid transport system substrate-binding protein